MSRELTEINKTLKSLDKNIDEIEKKITKINLSFNRVENKINYIVNFLEEFLISDEELEQNDLDDSWVPDPEGWQNKEEDDE